MWTQIFKYAAGISSGLSLVAFLAALYVWLQSQKSERSILGTIKGKGIIDAETIVQVLKQFSSDESRLEALQKVLGYDQSRASDVLKKVKSDVDVEKFSFVDQTHFLHRLVITGVVLLILAAIAAFGFKAGTIATNVPVTIKSVSQGNLAPARQTILTIMTEDKKYIVHEVVPDADGTTELMLAPGRYLLSATGAKDSLPFEVAPPKTIITIQVSGSEIKYDSPTNQLPPSASSGGNSSENASLGEGPSRSGVSQIPAMIWNAKTREWVTSPENEAAANSALQHGLRLLESGKPDEAKQFFDRAIQLNPKYADAYYNRSLAYYNLGKFEDSLRDSNSVLGLTPEDEEALNNRGYTYSTIKQYKKALADFNEAIRLRPDYARAYGNRGDVYLELAQYRKALADYNKAVTLEPHSSVFLQQRARIRRLLRDFSGAEADLKKAEDVDN